MDTVELIALETEDRNHPPPQDPRPWQERLTKLGGLNDHGEPILKLVWAQTATKWFRGKRRIKYRDMNRSVVRHETYRRVNGGKERSYPDRAAALKDIWPGSVIQVKVDYEWIGKPLWAIEQWFPPDYMGDTPESWEKNRWKEVNDEEMGHVARCDMLGPYPRNGYYDVCVWVGEHRGEFTPAGQHVLHFQPLCEAWFEDLRERLIQRENAEQLDPAQVEADIAAAEILAAEKVSAEEKYRRTDMAKTLYHMHAKDRVFGGMRKGN